MMPPWHTAEVESSLPASFDENSITDESAMSFLTRCLSSSVVTSLETILKMFGLVKLFEVL